MTDRRMSKYRYRKENRGATMVETLVAFVVLMIILGIIYGMIAFSSKLRMRAHDTDMAVRTFGQEIYNPENKPAAPGEGEDVKTSDHSGNHISSTYYRTGTSVSGTTGNEVPVPLFYLSLDTTETDLSANVKNTAYETALKGETSEDASQDEKDAASEKQKSYWLSLYNIEADTYTYVPGTGEDAEHLIVPKAVQFIHKEDRTDE